MQTKKADYLNEIYASSDIQVLNEDTLSELFQIGGFKIEKFKGINRSTSLLSNDIVGKVFNDSDIGVIKKEITEKGLLIYVENFTNYIV